MNRAAPPRPDEGVVSWNINTSCNYRCGYCTQKFKDDRGRWSRDTPLFLAGFARLEGRWEIKISGGEPFVHPTLIEIVEGLSSLGHRISIVTNFSAKDERLRAFVFAAKGRLGVVSLSLHLDYVDDVAAFLARARGFEALLREGADPALPSPHVCVTTVATAKVLPRLRALAAQFEEGGIAFKVQPEKLPGQDGALATYAPADQELLERLGGHNRTGEIAHDFSGRLCWAGARYVVMDDRGEVYRCYPARRATLSPVQLRRSPGPLAPPGRMGNFLDPGFRLTTEPRPCAYRHCYCTVPISRGMMLRERQDEASAPCATDEREPR